MVRIIHLKRRRILVRVILLALAVLGLLILPTEEFVDMIIALITSLGASGPLC